MINCQLRLRLENPPGVKRRNPSQRRPGRAQWWFEKMRGIVDHAPDWPPADLSSEATPVAATTPRQTPEADSTPTPRPYRWQFSRARQAGWE